MRRIWTGAAAIFLLAVYGNLGPTSPESASRPYAKSVVLVIMENRDYNRIIGSLQAPYTNHVLVPQAALMTNSHAVAHPSLPNYFALFSGSTQDVTNDSCPHAFGTENIGAELVSAGQTFAGYSESMPYDGYTGCFVGKYARKHNPWVNFTNVPASSNLVYEGFPKNPPTLAIIVPNLCNDMHDCSTQTGDAWLKKNLPPILAYDKEHQGLLILTWDEADPDAKGTNQIATLLIGPMVLRGSFNQWISHYSVLRTIETIAGVPCTGNACQAADLKGIWR
ncbi:MAG: alkaline phosphatase family protein [Candidatus Cybelea sp.]